MKVRSKKVTVEVYVSSQKPIDELQDALREAALLFASGIRAGESRRIFQKGLRLGTITVEDPQ